MNTSCAWEPSATYSEFLQSCYGLLRDVLNWSPSQARNYDGLVFPCFARFTALEVASVIACIPLWAILRFRISNSVSRVLCDFYESAEGAYERVSESFYHTTCHALLWLMTVYVVLYDTDCSAFIKPSVGWQGFSPLASAKLSEQVLHIAALSSYLFSFFNTAFVDERRKDFIVLLAHHVITIVLIALGYTTRSHRMGLVVLFVHDVCDVFLELGKLCHYLKVNTKGQVNTFLKNATLVNFVLLLITWGLCRIFWYPLRAIVGATKFPRSSPDFRIFAMGNSFLFLLFIMDVYWYYQIIKIATKALSGDDLEDRLAYKKDEQKEAQD